MLGRERWQNQPEPALAETPETAGEIPLLTIAGSSAKLQGKFDIADSIHIECEVGGELRVGGKLLIGRQGVVKADVETVDAVITGQYDGNMVATGNVEVAATGRVTGNIETDSLVIAKGGFFSGNVVRSKDGMAQRGLRPVYLLEDKRAAAQQ